jgi:hypothetical protein
MTAATLTRLSRLEAKRAAQPAPQIERPLTEAEFNNLVVDMCRDGGLFFASGQWQAKPAPFYASATCEPLADAMNAWAQANPGAVFMPMYDIDVDAALEALAGGRLWLSRTDYMTYHWLNLDSSGYPRLTGRVMAVNGEALVDGDLADAVQTATRLVHAQTGEPRPVVLGDYADWLTRWRPCALELENEN